MNTKDNVLSAARADFRRSAGFQIMFVLYSGLEPAKAIDHLCSAADRLAGSELAALREENERLKAIIRQARGMHGVCPKGLGFGWHAGMQRACSACDAADHLNQIGRVPEKEIEP